jgi:hypothetical protein
VAASRRPVEGRLRLLWVASSPSTSWSRCSHGCVCGAPLGNAHGLSVDLKEKLLEARGDDAHVIGGTACDERLGDPLPILTLLAVAAGTLPPAHDDTG